MTVITLTPEEITKGKVLFLGWLKYMAVAGFDMDSDLRLLGSHNLLHIEEMFRKKHQGILLAQRPEEPFAAEKHDTMIAKLNAISLYMKYLRGDDHSVGLAPNALFPMFRKTNVYALSSQRVYVWVLGQLRLGRVVPKGTLRKRAVLVQHNIGSSLLPLRSSAVMSMFEALSLLDQRDTGYVELWARNSRVDRKVTDENWEDTPTGEQLLEALELL